MYDKSVLQFPLPYNEALFGYKCTNAKRKRFSDVNIVQVNIDVVSM